MQFLAGGTLDVYVRQYFCDGQMPEHFARVIFRQIGSALDYLHNAKMVVHRDLKPGKFFETKKDHLCESHIENVVCSKRRPSRVLVKLIDFEGACHLVDDHIELGNSYGTVPYTAPEVADVVFLLV
jgi:serine/threonine protein kinase